MMRITSNQINRNSQQIISERYADLAKLQEQLASGKRLQKPSDDPVDVSNVLNLRTKLSQYSQFGENITDGVGFMGVTDTAMQSMNVLFQRMRELAIQGSTDTIDATERIYIQREVEQLTRQLISLSNSKHKGDYVFAGTQTKVTPFPLERSQGVQADDYASLGMAYFDGSAGVGVASQLRDAYTGEPLTHIMPGSFSLSVGGTMYRENTDFTVDYVAGTITPLNAALAVDVSEGGAFSAGPNGYYDVGGFSINFEFVGHGRDIYGDRVVNTGQVMRQIEEDITIAINITGEELMYDPSTGTNLLDTVIRLGQDLIHNDRAGVQAGIGRIDNSFQNILTAQSRNGARINMFEITLERNEQQTIETTRLQAELEDVDFADAATKFALMQTAYEAALKSTGKIIQMSLANFV